jgi:GNAT superfamily N-acetyltransferase
MAAPLDKTFDWTLRDGTRLRLRPIRPDDKARLKAALPGISAENLYRRFFMPVVQLSEQQLRFLTEVDQVHHIAWLAVAADEVDEPLVGVARCVQFDEQPELAESAILVVDRYQHRGVGTLLLALLSLVAAHQGVTVLRSFALEENLPFLRTMMHLGAKSRWEYANVRRVDLPVFTAPEQVPVSHPFQQVLAEVTARLA